MERAKDLIADEQWVRAIDELKAAANDPKEKHLIAGGHHSDLPEVMGAGYGDVIHAFVDPRLAP